VTEVGEYQLIASLGRGGMADVYLAARRGPQNFTKLVVIKRLREDLGEPRYRTLMLDEAGLAARLHHPNIVQTNEVNDRDGLPYLVMEYLDGRSVTQVMRAARHAQRSVPPGFAVRVVSEVLAALVYAHGLADYDGRPLGIVHRDISPQNIFCTYDGQIKLMDFGVAKYSLATTRTEVGLIKGKVPYMAPEQARGERIDQRVDVFAVGIMMWELLAQRRLFRGPTQAAELHNVLYMAVPSLTTEVPGIDPALAAVCAQALERNRDARFPDAATMLAALEGTTARPATREQTAELVSGLFVEQRAAVSQQIKAALAGEGMPVANVVAGDSLTTSVEIEQAESGSATAPTVHLQPGAPVSTAEAVAPRRRMAVFATLLIAVLGACAATAVYVAMKHEPPKAGPAAASASPVGPPPPPGHAALRMCGSNTIGSELAPALAEAFLAKKGATQVVRRGTTDPEHTIVAGMLAGKELDIDVVAHGSATAFEGLAAKNCDIGMASRAINASELAKLASEGDLRSPATEHVIALDGIAVIVNPNSKLRTLDRTALHNIFTGAITDWSAVGGAPGPIKVYARDDKSGTYDTFKNLVLGGDKLVASAQRFSSSEQLADNVATDPAAIGFIGLAYIRSAKALAVGDTGTETMMPTSFTVTTEDYLLSRRLYFYTPASPGTALVPELVSFAMSAQGQTVVRDAGFVDLTVAVHPGSLCVAHCPSGYLTATSGAKRLSLDFRFREGSDEIDSRATRDLDRLTQTLRGYPDATLLLFGFSDSSGDSAVNVALSRQRAKAIAAELAARGITAVTVDGFGPALPVASNTTPAGRERNRRVEVWLR
jgi:phosphate transport system substrate-binding protein